MTRHSTLKELVEGTVEGFIATETSFSIFDVTQSIRQLVNSGAVDVLGLFVDSATQQTQVMHDDVKFYFNELLSEDTFSSALAVKYNGTFRTYVPAATPDLTAFKILPLLNIATSPAAAVVKQPSAAGYVATQAGNSGKLRAADVIERVRTYFDNCKASKKNPTPKQIQSAVKRGGKSTGWSRAELSTIWRDIANGSI